MLVHNKWLGEVAFGIQNFMFSLESVWEGCGGGGWGWGWGIWKKASPMKFGEKWKKKATFQQLIYVLFSKLKMHQMPPIFKKIPGGRHAPRPHYLGFVPLALALAPLALVPKNWNSSTKVGLLGNENKSPNLLIGEVFLSHALECELAVKMYNEWVTL